MPPNRHPKDHPNDQPGNHKKEHTKVTQAPLPQRSSVLRKGTGGGHPKIGTAGPGKKGLIFPKNVCLSIQLSRWGWGVREWGTRAVGHPKIGSAGTRAGPHFKNGPSDNFKNKKAYCWPKTMGIIAKTVLGCRRKLKFGY